MPATRRVSSVRTPCTLAAAPVATVVHTRAGSSPSGRAASSSSSASRAPAPANAADSAGSRPAADERVEERRIEPVDRDQADAQAARHHRQRGGALPSAIARAGRDGVEQQQRAARTPRRRRPASTRQDAPGTPRRPQRRAGAGDNQRQRAERHGVAEQQADRHGDRQRRRRPHDGVRRPPPAPRRPSTSSVR